MLHIDSTCIFDEALITAYRRQDAIPDRIIVGAGRTLHVDAMLRDVLPPQVKPCMMTRSK